MIGGPGTSLPKPIESFLSWALCISCLSVSGYHYYVTNYIKPFWMKIRHKQIVSVCSYGGATSDGTSSTENCTVSTPLVAKRQKISAPTQSQDYGIPLTTHSRAELYRRTPMERYSELIHMVYHYYAIESNNKNYLKDTSETVQGKSICSNDRNESEKENVIQYLDDDTIVSLVRDNSICRHLVSLLMRRLYQNGTPSSSKSLQPLSLDKCSSSKHINSALPLVPNDGLCGKILMHRLEQLWPRLLELPPAPSTPPSVSPAESTLHFKKNASGDDGNKNAVKGTYHISLVVPCYNESTTFIQNQMKCLLEKCHSPQHIQIIIVNAGGSDIESCQILVQDNDGGDNNNNNSAEKSLSFFGDVKVLSFTSGGGRGPTMNYGANVACGLILTFCHLDTRLPHNWDVKICDILMTTGSDTSALDTPIRANSCAFAFGIDTSPEGLLNPFTSSSVGYFPPGIKAVETTANIRTQLFSLPYGDQAISVAKNVFDFVGGFPDQCLMEDYELVALLRKRASLVTRRREQLKIIPGEPALCSPRRWQKHGVLFVTYTNSKLVNLYAGGMSADDLYRQYYGRDPPNRESDLSPWEIEMQEMNLHLQSSTSQ